jgi:hypothetical protein
MALVSLVLTATLPTVTSLNQKTCLFVHCIAGHSGSISSKHPDINFFFFFVIYVSCNLCDDVFEGKNYFFT